MKRLTASITALGLSLLITSPAFAYTVKSGDTMSKIAEENNVTLHELSRLNPQVRDLDLIYVGDEIKTEGDGTETVQISSYKATPAVNISGYERDLLTRLVRAEAQGESFAGKVAVAEVVLNRVESQKFPNSIETVIYQKGQFSPVNNGSINTPADDESFKAVDQALGGSNSVGESLFFYNPMTASSRWLDSKPTVAVVGNHTFK